MFHIKIGDLTHVVTFRYKDRTTYCTIGSFTPDDEIEAVATSAAVCGKADPFVKNKGRKIAMARCLVGYPYHERKQFWAAYFKARNGKY